jgi:hypothetical protein
MGVFRHSGFAAAVVVLGVFWVPPTVAADSPRAVAGWVLTAIVGAAMVLRERPAAAVTAAVATVLGAAWGVSEDPMLATAWCLYPLAVARAARTGREVLILIGLLPG